MTKLTPADLESVRSRHLAGESPTKIAATYGMSPASIRERLMKMGVYAARPLGAPRTLKFRADAFDRLEGASAYWLGYLIADGYITTKKHHIALAANGEDGPHVERFRAFLGADSSVRISEPGRGAFENSKQMWRLTIYSRSLVERLLAIGFTVGSETRFANPDVEDDLDFWRGVVDGDGYTTRAGRNSALPVVGLTGHRPLLDQFREFVHRRAGAGRSAVLPAPGMHRYTVNGVRAETMIRLLYDNEGISLPRKRDKALATLLS